MKRVYLYMNLNSIFKILIFIFYAFFTLSAFAKDSYMLNSPDKKINLLITKKSEDGYISYSLNAFDKELIASSAMGYKTSSCKNFPDATWTIESVKENSVNSTWEPLWAKRAIVLDVYNEIVLDLSNKDKTASMQIIARAYNDAVAFRYIFNKIESEKVECELTKFNFAGDFTAWYPNGENHNIGPEKLSRASGNRKVVMTIKASDNHFLAIHEADISYGVPLVLESQKGETSFCVNSKPKLLHKGFQSAWRVVLLGEKIGTLVDSHAIELLNPEATMDFSWVKAGLSLWDWRANGAVVDDFTYRMDYASWQRLVDFASEQGFAYLVLDANWYGKEFSDKSNPTQGGKAEDVKNIIAYAKAKNVGIWLYLNDRASRNYSIEDTLKQYHFWGAVGVKYGFMKGNLEEKNIKTRKITKLCAENKLLVNFHDGPVHPYGQMRSFPNALTREFCQAQLDGHKVFMPKTFVTSVFVNMLAGPLDMNNGMFDLRQGNTTRADENKAVPSTLASEAARTLITFSGATILPDAPEFYKKYPILLRFLREQKMPWLQSKTLLGEIGEYIVMMRESKDAYLIGVACNENEHQLSIDLDFLGEKTYTAFIVEDGDNAHYLTNREEIKEREIKLIKSDSIKVKLACGGGACIIIEKN